MSIWPENTDKIITIVAPYDASIEIDYKIRNTSEDFTTAGITLTYNNGDQWDGILNLPVGEYMIRTTISASTFSDIVHYSPLGVIPMDKYDLRINQNIIKDKITSSNSWKTMS